MIDFSLIIIIFCTILTFIILLNTEKKEVKVCKPHNWVRKEVADNSYLCCSICKLVPSENGPSYEEKEP